MACIPGLEPLCKGVGGLVTAAGNDVFGSIVSSIATGFGKAVDLMLTFWVAIPTPQLSASSGPVGAMTGNLAWLTGAVAVAGILIAATRMMLQRSSRPAVDLAKGLGRLVAATFVLLPAMALGAKFGDAYSGWVIDQGAGGQFGAHVLNVVAGLSQLTPGLLLVVAVLGVLSALVQIVLMFLRVGVLIVLAGVVPLLAAGSSTQTGEHAYKRALHWMLAFLLYKPLAATLYATAFYAVGTKDGVVQSLAGYTLILLAILALPALLALVHPAVEAATSLTGGAMHRNGQMVASGAMQVARLARPAGAARAATGAAAATVATVTQLSGHTRGVGGQQPPTGSTPAPARLHAVAPPRTPPAPAGGKTA